MLVKPFQLSLMFASKAGECPSEAPLKGSSWLYPKILDFAGMACQGKTI